VEVETAPYPGFPTDLQAQLMALMTMADGTSEIRETIFENRFMHVQELAASAPTSARRRPRHGPRRREAARRPGHGDRPARLGVAGDRRSAAEGDTVVNRVYHLDRGFEALESKLSACGADIVRISS
jgi:UDP-N-acetylglucosamine 1-carboxyvinyltransferase